MQWRAQHDGVWCWCEEACSSSSMGSCCGEARNDLGGTVPYLWDRDVCEKGGE